jgi:NADPH:quinone reductase-like Zn-dependent oxidoreductase
MAKAIGAKSIAVTRSEAKEEALLAVGADQVIIAGREDVQEAILDLTEGLGAEMIYDAVAGPGLEELVATICANWSSHASCFLQPNLSLARVPIPSCSRTSF